MASSSGSRGAVAYLSERAEDAAEAFRDLLGRTTGGAAILGSKAGSARYLDTGDDKVALIASQIDAREPELQLEGLRRIVAMISKGRDASRFLPGALKLTSSPSLEVRKLVYIVILHYAQHSADSEDLTLLSVNSFQRDSMDSSPLIRGMAIRVLTGLRSQMVASIVELTVKRATRDSSAYVRKVTALALPRCVESDPSHLSSHLGSLSTLLGDRSPGVIGAALVAFQRIFQLLSDQIQQSDGTSLGDDGAAAAGSSSSAQSPRQQAYARRWELLHPHYRKICHALADLDEWSQVAACEVLLQYARSCFEQPADMGDDDVEERELEGGAAAGKGKVKATPGPEPSGAASRRASNREADLDLLVTKSAQLFSSYNAAVVLAACRLHYYLLPCSRHQQLVHALAGLCDAGNSSNTDRDTIYVALCNILWLLNGGAAQPVIRHTPERDVLKLAPAQQAQRRRAARYAEMLSPYITRFWPRSDCSKSRFAPGSLSLLSLINGPSASSTGSGAASAFSAAAAGIGGLTLPAALASVTAAGGVGGMSGGTGGGWAQGSSSSASATHGSSTANDPIFHAKLEIVERLAAPQNLVWLFEELEDTARFEWRQGRATHAVEVMAHVVQRFGREWSAARSVGETRQPDRWGVQARATELALELLADISRTPWSVRQTDQRKSELSYEKEDHAMPLRRGVAAAAIRLLLSVAVGKAEQVAELQSQRQKAIAEDKDKGKAPTEGAKAVPSTAQPSTEGLVDELQQDIFDILEKASSLLYTSGEVVGGKKLKLIGKRNISDAEGRKALFWLLGALCRTQVEVHFKDGGKEASARTLSAAELLCPSILHKAASNFAKEPSKAKFEIATMAVKVYAVLHSTPSATADDEVRRSVAASAEQILQLAARDPNLFLQARAQRYFDLFADVPESGLDEEKTAAFGKIVDRLFKSGVTEAGVSERSAAAQDASVGSLALLLGDEEVRLRGSAFARVADWAAVGSGVPSSKRDPPASATLASGKDGSGGSFAFVSSLDKPSATSTPRATSPAPATKAALSAPSAHDYVVEGEETPGRVGQETSKGGKSKAQSLFSSAVERPVNPKYQDLDSFLDEEPEEPAMLIPVPVGPLPVQRPFDSLSMLERPAPQDDEYRSGFASSAPYRDEPIYDEDDFEEEDDEEEEESEDDDDGAASGGFGAGAAPIRAYDGPAGHSDVAQTHNGAAGRDNKSSSAPLLPEEENAWA